MGKIIIEKLGIHFRKNEKKSAIPIIGRKITVWKALDSISFTATNGERIGIIGRNGAGKSTLLKAISGIYPPHEGQIEICGSIIPLLELGAGFDPRRSVRENIYLNGAVMGLTNKQVGELEQEVLDFANLQNFADQSLKYLSSGMRSRLGFSIATSYDPEILILDEVFAAGDASFLEKAKKRMYSMIERCHILLLVSHRLSLIEELCTRVIIIDKGKLVFDGPTEEGIPYYENKIVGSTEESKTPPKRVKLL